MTYLGYGLKAGVEGFQTGFNMGQMKWQQNEKKKLEKKQEELLESSTIFNNMVSTAGEDGFYSDDEQMKINAAYTALSYEVKERVDGSMKAMQAMDKKTVEANNQWIDYIREGIEGLDPKNVQGIFDFVRPNIQGEKGLLALDALESITKKRQGIAQEEKAWERVSSIPGEYRVPYLEEQGIAMPEPEVTPTAPKMADEKSAIDVLKVFVGATPEQFNNQKAILEQRTGLDLSNYTQEILKESGTEMFNLYNTPEEVMNSVKAPEGLTVVPSRDSKTGKYYASFQKKATTPEPGVTEGEITAGQKRSWDMASSVMFGSSDWVTGISKPGIISQAISNKLNMGQKLTEDDNAEVRNNYNAIKGTLPDEIKSVIESQLQRYGIPLEAPVEAPITETAPPPEQPGVIQKGVTAVKDWLGMKGTPEAGEAQKDYTTMNEEELYNLAMAGDKLAYEEAKRRGLIE